MHEKEEEESIPRINLFGNRQSQDENGCGFGAVSLAKQCEDSKSSFKTDSSFEDEDLEGDEEESYGKYETGLSPSPEKHGEKLI